MTEKSEDEINTMIKNEKIRKKNVA